MLTEKALKALRPRAALYRVTDERGLCIEVHPTGGRYWRMRYRFGSTQKMLSLGVYPDVPLLLARERRDAARKLVAQGIDPSALRKTEKAADALTFEAIAREWLARQDLAPATAKKHRWLLERHVLPVHHVQSRTSLCRPIPGSGREWRLALASCAHRSAKVRDRPGRV